MTTINVPRELLEQAVCLNQFVQLDALQKIRALLSEQPQAGAGQAAPVVPEWFINTLRKSFTLLEEEGLDEFVHCCECHIQRERKRLHAIIDAALSAQQQVEKEADHE